jgi:tRNA(fMet)-specific endonuclease VapC
MEIKTRLRQKGTLIEDFDLLIAATALNNNLVLVTNNVDHFTRIEKLQIENWKAV